NIEFALYGDDQRLTDDKIVRCIQLIRCDESIDCRFIRIGYVIQRIPRRNNINLHDARLLINKKPLFTLYVGRLRYMLEERFFDFKDASSVGSIVSSPENRSKA